MQFNAWQIFVAISEFFSHLFLPRLEMKPTTDVKSPRARLSESAKPMWITPLPS